MNRGHTLLRWRDNSVLNPLLACTTKQRFVFAIAASELAEIRSGWNDSEGSFYWRESKRWRYLARILFFLARFRQSWKLRISISWPNPHSHANSQFAFGNLFDCSSKLLHMLWRAVPQSTHLPSFRISYVVPQCFCIKGTSSTTTFELSP